MLYSVEDTIIVNTFPYSNNVLYLYDCKNIGNSIVNDIANNFMATFNYILGRKKDNGKYPIYLRITHRNKNTSLSLDIEVAKTEWSTARQRIKKSNTDIYDVRTEKEQNNDFLDALMDRANDVVRLADKRGVLKEMTAVQIKSALLDYSPNHKQVEGSGDFIQYWRGIMMETPKSQEKYEYALKAVINYHISVTGKDYISFKDITTDWVRCFLAFLKNAHQYTQGKGKHIKYKDLSAWSISTYSSCLKKVLNCAIDAGRLSLDVMRGFRKFKAGIVYKEPYTLSIDELRELMYYPFKTMRQRVVRDLFIFSFCTMGMNFKDIYFLSKKDVKWDGDMGEISYVRQKTTKPISVLINSNATNIQDLIYPYIAANRSNIWSVKGGSNYFALSSMYPIYKYCRGNFTKVIREIREIMGYDDSFTFYTARDSWATILSSDYDLGRELVDAGLGHSTKSLADNHYIAKHYEKLFDVHAERPGI